MRYLLTWVSCAGKEEDSLLGLLAQISKKEQEKERCTRVGSKGKASPAGAFLSRRIRLLCFPAPHSPPTWTSPSSKAILGSILLAHLPHRALNLYPCLLHGCTLASIRRSPGLFTSPCDHRDIGSHFSEVSLYLSSHLCELFFFFNCYEHL